MIFIYLCFDLAQFKICHKIDVFLKNFPFYGSYTTNKINIHNRLFKQNIARDTYFFLLRFIFYLNGCDNSLMTSDN